MSNSTNSIFKSNHMKLVSNVFSFGDSCYISILNYGDKAIQKDLYHLNIIIILMDNPYRAFFSFGYHFAPSRAVREKRKKEKKKICHSKNKMKSRLVKRGKLKEKNRYSLEGKSVKLMRSLYFDGSTIQQCYCRKRLMCSDIMTNKFR